MHLIWSADAQNDVYDILEHYDRIDPALADEMALRIESGPLPLLDFAAIGALVEGRAPLRKWSVPASPFILLYIAAQATIEVRRVVHAASDWQRHL
jgi:plasmid stabilization system protein ParE